MITWLKLQFISSSIWFNIKCWWNNMDSYNVRNVYLFTLFMFKNKQAK